MIFGTSRVKNAVTTQLKTLAFVKMQHLVAGGVVVEFTATIARGR